MLKQKIISYALLLIITSLYSLVKQQLSPYNNKDIVVFLNVGTGDSILIKSKNDAILVDGGPNSYSTNEIYKYINFKPGAYLATHLHSDHISGLLKLLDSKTNYDLFLYPQNSSTYEALKLSAKKHTSLKQGDVLYLNNFKLEIIYPTSTCYSENLNDCSYVILVTHSGGKKILLMSDSEFTPQENYKHLLPPVEYVKVPHQGSDDSLNMDVLKRLSPGVAVISVGENSYGHPKQVVIDYYESQGIKVLRTDEEGDIVLFFE